MFVEQELVVALLGRVSSEDQKDRGTIENQVEFGRKYADLHQFEIKYWYLDDGVSGTIPLELRPEGKRLLDDAKAGKFNLLLIYRLDRLGRSARIILNAVHELEGYGVKIKSMTEPFDTGDPSGRFLLTILAGVADLEHDTILERMWIGANRAAKDGKWLGGIVPYGYFVNENGFLEINESPLPGCGMSEADVVRLIYNLLIEKHLSAIKIADYLNALNIPTAYIKDGRRVTKGKRKEATAGIWRPSRVRCIIVNTVYKGIHYYGKRSAKQNRELIPRQTPALVSEEVWERGQEVLRENRIDSMRNATRIYILRGLIKCGMCGRSYHGTNYSGPGRKLKAFYICGGKAAYGTKCNNQNIPAEWLENLVWEDCKRFILNPGEIIDDYEALENKQVDKKSSLTSERDITLRAIREKESEKTNILNLYRRQLINENDIEHQLNIIAVEKEFLEKRLAKINEHILSDDLLINRQKTAYELLRQLREGMPEEPDREYMRKIINFLVESIIVFPTSGEEGNPKTQVKIKYLIGQGSDCTDKRADINLGMSIEKCVRFKTRWEK
jgi:site-specific DNA recombinase